MKILQTPILEKVIFEPGKGGYHDYRIPGIVALNNGNILLACEARAENLGDWGDIDVVILRVDKEGNIKEVLKIGESTATDSGLLTSGKTMRTYNNPTLVTDNEAIHLIYHKNYEQAFVVTSNDQGDTWSKSREITSTFKDFDYEWKVCATGPGHGIQTENGRLIAPIWLAEGNLTEDGLTRAHWPSIAGSIYSDDHGLTWHPGALAPQMDSGNETTVAQGANGDILYNFRSRNENRQRMLGISKDGGESFSDVWSAEQLKDPMCFGSMVSYGKGTLFANCDSQTHRVNAVIKYTEDQGKNWEKVLLVDPVGGYIDIAVSGNKLWVFYEQYSYEKRIVEALVLKCFSIID